VRHHHTPLEIICGVRDFRADAPANMMVRQDPWSVMPRLQDEINRLFGNVQQTEWGG
jgi:hypothetical protein